MLSAKKKSELQVALKNLCQSFNLDYAYLAWVQGKRRHFLAGHGEQTFSNTQRMKITERVVLFWQGSDIDRSAVQLDSALCCMVADIEAEMNPCDQII